MKTLMVRPPQLCYAKAYLKSGVEKYQERVTKFLNELENTENGIWGCSGLYLTKTCDTPFFIKVPKNKATEIEKELKRIDFGYETKEERKDETIYWRVIHYVEAHHGNRVYFIGSIDSIVYRYLYRKGKKWPFEYSIEID